MAVSFSGEDLIKRSLLSSILGLKIKTPKFQHLQQETPSKSHGPVFFDYNQPCSSKTIFLLDSRKKALNNQLSPETSSTSKINCSCQYPLTLTTHQECRKKSFTINDVHHPESVNFVPETNVGDVYNNHHHDFLNTIQFNQCVQGNEHSLSDHLAESLFLASPQVEKDVTGNDIVNDSCYDSHYPKLCSPHDIYQEILHECEPLLDKPEFEPQVFEKNQLYDSDDSNKFEKVTKSKPHIDGQPISGLNNFDDFFTSPEFRVNKSGMTPDITGPEFYSSTCSTPQQFYCYNEDGGYENQGIENKKNKISQHVRPFSAYPQLNSLNSSQINETERKYINEMEYDSGNFIAQRRSQSITVSPTRVRHYTAPSRNVMMPTRDSNLNNDGISKTHNFESIVTQSNLLPDTYFHSQLGQQHHIGIGTASNFQESNYNDIEYNNFQQYQQYPPTYEQCQSDKLYSGQTQTTMPYQQSKNQIFIERQQHSDNLKGDLKFGGKPTDRLTANKDNVLMKSATEVLSAVLGSADGSDSETNAFLPTDDDNNSEVASPEPQQQHQQKLMSILSAAGQLSLEELVKIVVTAVKESGVLHTEKADNKMDTTLAERKKILNAKRKEKLLLAETPEEILQRKRTQNNEAAARYRKRQRNAKQISEDELDILSHKNSTLKAEIEIIDREISILKERFTLTGSRDDIKAKSADQL